MNEERLTELLESTEVLRRLIGDLEGPYAIGVTSDPANPDEAAIRVRVAEDPSNIPSRLWLDGEAIRVLVTPNFQPLFPLAEVGPVGRRGR